MAADADRLHLATQALLRSFVPRTGRWRTPTGEAWQPALAVEAVLLAYEGSRDERYLAVVAASFRRYAGRRSEFFDDDGWYLNAWLRAYDVIGERGYLDEARSLFEAMAHGWDGACGGGVWWNARRSYKNAITNELFLLAAARLYRRTGHGVYHDWADRAWRWFDASGMINREDLVNDGLDAHCMNNGQPTWTYNQGVILGALVEWWRGTGDDALLARAVRIATATVRTLVHDGGVLREACEPSTDNRDAHAFKGVFAQGLGRLVPVRPSGELTDFLARNADAAWAAGLGMRWVGDPGPINAATRASAVMAIGAATVRETAPSTMDT